MKNVNIAGQQKMQNPNWRGKIFESLINKAVKSSVY